MEEKLCMDYKAAAQLLGIKVNTLYGMVRKGQIPHIRLGPRFVRFSKHALEEWLSDCAVTGTWTHDGSTLAGLDEQAS